MLLRTTLRNSSSERSAIHFGQRVQLSSLCSKTPCGFRVGVLLVCSSGLVSYTVGPALFSHGRRLATRDGALKSASLRTEAHPTSVAASVLSRGCQCTGTVSWTRRPGVANLASPPSARELEDAQRPVERDLARL